MGQAAGQAAGKAPGPSEAPTKKGPGLREAASAQPVRNKPTSAAATAFRRGTLSMFVRCSQNGGLPVHARRFRTNVMPSPDRYRNILWFALAVWIGATAILS